MFLRIIICLLLICAIALPQQAQSQIILLRPGAIIMKIAPSADISHSRRILPADVSIDSMLGSNIWSLRVPVGQEAAHAQQLAALPGVMYAQVDHAVAAQVQPDDARYLEQWNMPRIRMPEAWNVITDTSNLIIATIDTGIDLQHPDLRDQLWTNPGEIAGNGVDDDGNGYIDDIHGWHFYQVYSGGQALPQDNGLLDDVNGHGTHVAGIIAAAGNNAQGVAGVAWRARLMPVRVLDNDAVGWESDVVRGLQYAVANGANVVNLSLGLATPGPALAEAVAQAEAQGVLLVAAAGNNGGAALYPAAYPSVLSVGASTQADLRAAFSNRGSRLDLLAPGVDILSTWNGLPYFARSGTSMAAPHVAGVAALLRTLRPEDSPAQIRACLLRTAHDLGVSGRDDDTGWGLLDAAKALHGCPHTVYVPVVQS